MSETLSVIDEHMNDMSTPTSTFTNDTKRDTTNGGSVYSTKSMNRFSFIAGHETDEEEHQLHTEEEVMVWSPARVAEYLEDHGVEKAHCDLFKEQEISGEVLLAMDQSSIFLKEFDLGPVGRRLKTWHKIRALQDEVRQQRPPDVPRSNSEYSGAGEDDSPDPSISRASTMGSALPRALDTSRQSIAAPGRSNTTQGLSQTILNSNSAYSGPISPLQGLSSMSRSESTYRPSAQTIRQMQHSRRHSSIDSTTSSNRQGHRKQPSFDSKWQPGQPQINGSSAGHAHTLSSESNFPKRQSSLLTPTAADDLDRGYFSSNELDSRSRPKVLTKKGASASGTAVHSRAGSATNQMTRRSTQSGRIASSDSLRSPVSPMADSPTVAQGLFGALNAVGNTFGSVRSMTSPQLNGKPFVSSQDSSSPVVTRLEDKNPHSPAIGTPPQITMSMSSNRIPFFSSNKPKVTGLRTTSEAITRTERFTASPTKDSHNGSPARTGSTTPSTEATSIDMQKSELSRTSQGSATNLVPPSATQRRPRPKTKKATSAYTRGLEKKSPAEQLAGCDYSGWMKKKSGSLMTTWKTRLFVLRGRRLSYYYADNDAEEKGLIDISFHRVLPAHKETLTGFHATVTGAAGTPTSPRDSTTPTNAEKDLKEHPAAAGDDGIFIFKLVPPKSGLSKGVNFTKPTVHYFAVNSRQEGRLWMAALMKATIDRDEDGMVTTTYNQKTISLAKARARRERPPALKEEVPDVRPAELDGADERDSRGLGIGGLLGIIGLAEDSDTVAGADEEHELDAGNSAAPSAVTTAEAPNPQEPSPAMAAALAAVGAAST